MMEFHEFQAMNTDILLLAERLYPKKSFEMAQDFILECEQRFSRFRKTSELSALNQAAGDWCSVSPEMIDLLTTALDYHLKTGGLFDPSILPDLYASGYTSSFDQLPQHLPARDSISHPHNPAGPFDKIQLDAAQYRIKLPPGMQIDLGGIAKGWIVEKAARIMAKSSSACAVNAGGDIYLIGQPRGQAGWEIGLEDPYHPARDLMTLLVDEGAVATSSVIKRSWFQGDIQRHHLLDPRNGEPAKTPWVSVTVFASTAVSAEVFAKAILIAGPDETQILLDQNPDISFLAVDDQMQIWKSPTEKESINEYA